MRRYIAILFLSLGFAAARGAEPVVTSRLEPDSIAVADRFTYTIEVEKDLSQDIGFPEFAPDLSAGLELCESYPVDTVRRDGRRMTLRRRYVMQAFDEGNFNLGRAAVLYADKNILDTLYSENDNILKVGTFVIDSAALAKGPNDIKPQEELEFRFAEVRDIVIMSVVALFILAAVAVLVVWLIMRYGLPFRKRAGAEVAEPPHIVAIRALEELHNRKLWQNDKHKLYYSTISDILRTYLSGRYGIGAMEMTTDEIIEAVKGTDMDAKRSSDLITILRDADLVKFAKFRPEAGQNEDDWHKAYYFVEETKEAEPMMGDESEILDNKLKTR